VVLKALERRPAITGQAVVPMSASISLEFAAEYLVPLDVCKELRSFSLARRPRIPARVHVVLDGSQPQCRSIRQSLEVTPVATSVSGHVIIVRFVCYWDSGRGYGACQRIVNKKKDGETRLRFEVPILEAIVSNKQEIRTRQTLTFVVHNILLPEINFSAAFFLIDFRRHL